MSLSKIFGGRKRPQGPPLIKNISASTDAFRLAGGQSGDTFSTTLTALGTPVQSAFATRFPRQLSNLDTLRRILTPGFSDLRRQRLTALRDKERVAIGNLAENLARRRVLGSSFAQDALARAEAEFGRQESAVQGESFLAELATNLELIDREAKLIADSLNREISQLGVAAQSALGFSQVVANNARFQQERAAKEAAARGSLFGNLLGLGLGAFGAGGIFGVGGRFGPPDPLRQAVAGVLSRGA